MTSDATVVVNLDDVSIILNALATKPSRRLVASGARKLHAKSRAILLQNKFYCLVLQNNQQTSSWSITLN